MPGSSRRVSSTTATTLSRTVSRSASGGAVEEAAEPAGAGIVDQQVDAERLGMPDQTIAILGNASGRRRASRCVRPGRARWSAARASRCWSRPASRRSVEAGSSRAKARPMPLLAPVIKARWWSCTAACSSCRLAPARRRRSSSLSYGARRRRDRGCSCPAVGASAIASMPHNLHAQQSTRRYNCLLSRRTIRHGIRPAASHVRSPCRCCRRHGRRRPASAG